MVCGSSTVVEQLFALWLLRLLVIQNGGEHGRRQEGGDDEIREQHNISRIKQNRVDAR